MGRAELLPEIWLSIIQLLRCPLPRPTGNNPRPSIRQHTLTVCMRVNKLFNNITAPLLYSVIVTDHLPSLIYGHDLPPAAPDIPSKVGLLENLTRLYLEYSAKDHATYEQICREGKRHYVGVGLDEEGLMELCGQECDWIASAGKILSHYQCRKYSVSTGVFLHPQPALWEAFIRRASTPDSPRADAARQAISDLFLRPHPTFYCNRTEVGPLVYSALAYNDYEFPPSAPGGPHRPAHCAHLSGGPGIPPLNAGNPSRWYLQPGELRTDEEVEAAMHDLATTIYAFLETREVAHKQLAGRVTAETIATHSAVHVDVYVPSVMLDEEWKEIFTRGLEESIEASLKELRVPRERATRDKWRFLDVRDAPACPACSWCPEDG